MNRRLVGALAAVALGLVPVVTSATPASATVTTRQEFTCSDGWLDAETVDASGGHYCYIVGVGGNMPMSITSETAFVIKGYGVSTSSSSTGAQYRIDGGSWASYTSPTSASLEWAHLFFTSGTIAAGTHTLEMGNLFGTSYIDYIEIEAEDAPLNEVAEYPDYTCARWLDNLGDDHWRVTAVASENAPRENVTTEGPSLEFGAMVQDYFRWYVEFEDPGTNDVTLTGDGRTSVQALGPKLFDLDESDDGAPVDVANGYGMGFIVRRVTETGSGFKRPIPKTTDNPEEDAFVINRVGDHEEAIGYCDLHVKLDEQGLGATGTTMQSVAPPNVPDWGDGGSGQSLADCVPQGFQLLNPAAYVQGMACVLRWAFIPSGDQVQGVLDDFEETYDARFPFSMVGDLYEMVDTTVDAAQDGVAGGACPHIDFRPLAPSQLSAYSQLDVRAPTPTGSGCTGSGGVAGDVGGYRNWLRNGSRFGLWFLVMLGLSKKVGPKDGGPVMLKP